MKLSLYWSFIKFSLQWCILWGSRCTINYVLLHEMTLSLCQTLLTLGECRLTWSWRWSSRSYVIRSQPSSEDRKAQWTQVTSLLLMWQVSVLGLVWWQRPFSYTVPSSFCSYRELHHVQEGTTPEEKNKAVSPSWAPTQIEVSM